MNTGGAETLLMNIYRKIDRKKFVFYFLCFGSEKFDYEDEIEQLGGVIVRIKTLEELGIRKYIKEIMNVIKQNNIDIVHVHTYYNSIFSLIAAKKCGIKKRIVHSHNTKNSNKDNFITKIYATISKILIKKYANVYLACSPEAGEALFTNRKFMIIKNGIDINKFMFDIDRREKLRKQLNIDKNMIVIGNVARFYEQKNHNFLIDIFYEYQKLNPKSKLVLIGDGPLKQTIKEKVKKYNINDKVLFLGVRQDVNELYNIMDVFVFPSFYEGLGIVLIEAQANGLKCIVSDTIPREVKMLDNIEFVDLSQGEKKWANIIEKSNMKRLSDFTEIKKKGYSILETVGEIEKIYKGDK